MDLGGKRRSDNFEDRGSGGFGGGGGGIGRNMAFMAFFFVFRRFGIKGVLVLVLVVGGFYFLAPSSVKQSLFGGTVATASEGSTCDLNAANAKACDFSRAILASTEDVWARKFQQGALPDYDKRVSTYRQPTLVVFSGVVQTGGCGRATSAVGPFYCPADDRLYIDPNFYQVLAQKLHAPGDFAQAYVIAHEIGHHVQNLIGANTVRVPGETKNQTSVRAELQADCFAGVWGHSAAANLSISHADLEEALRAAHAIGDDALGYQNEAKFTHGSSAQRLRWFTRGFQSGDPRQCDTFRARTL